MLLNRDRAHAVMNRLALDALVASSPENVSYASDHECPSHWLEEGTASHAALTPGRSPEAFLVASGWGLEAVVESRVWIEDVYLVGPVGFAGPAREALHPAVAEVAARATRVDTAVDGLVQALAARGVTRGRIGLDERGTGASVWAAIARRLPGATLVAASTAWDEIRSVKTPEEIGRLRRAAEIAGRAVNATLALARPGVAEAELLRQYHQHVVVEGARPTSSALGGGPRASALEFLESDRPLETGDLVRYQVGCTHRGYHAAFARAVVLGTPTDEVQRLWEAVVGRAEAAIALVQPGADPRQVHATGAAPGHRVGRDDVCWVSCVRGLGLSAWDRPVVAIDDATRPAVPSPDAVPRFEEGMVINVGVGCLRRGTVGLLLEDTVLITGRGSVPLTHGSRALRLDDYLAGR